MEPDTRARTMVRNAIIEYNGTRDIAAQDYILAVSDERIALAKCNKVSGEFDLIGTYRLERIG